MKAITRKDVVALHSGGLDSSVMVAELLSTGNKVISLGVFYGQRHARELASARDFCASYGVERVEVDISAAMKPVLTGSALTDDSVPLPEGHYADESMKATIVPNRNMMLLSIAGAVAAARGAGSVAYAAHAGDHAIYPDCRPGFAGAMSEALALCSWEPIDLIRPFVHVDKTEIVMRGYRLQAPMHLTWSCYAGGEAHCGKCGTCVERREAFALAGIYDQTSYLA